MSDPLVSVVMPVYNGSAYLAEAIESILNQTLDSFEFIIIDDASSDTTPDIINGYQSTDQRIIYSRNEQNSGVAKSLNKGLSCARGKYIARMDADDISMLNRFEIQTEWLKANSAHVMCGSSVEFFGKKNSVKILPEDDEELRSRIFFEYPFEHPTWMMNGDLLRSNQLQYNEQAVAEDLDFIFKLMRIGKVHNVQEPLLKMRVHSKRTHILRKKQIQASVSMTLQEELGRRFKKEAVSIKMHINKWINRELSTSQEYLDWAVFISKLERQLLGESDSGGVWTKRVFDKERDFALSKIKSASRAELVFRLLKANPSLVCRKQLRASIYKMK